METSKKGCYRAFCAEYKHLGLNAVELMKRFKSCDTVEAQKLRRKWQDKLVPSQYARFCLDMNAKVPNLTRPQLAQLYRRQFDKPIKKKKGTVTPKMTHRPKATRGRFSSELIETFRKLTTLKDLEANTQTGYRYVIYDNRAKYSHAAYSFSIKVGRDSVRSRGFATADLAADAVLKQICMWLAEIDGTRSSSHGGDAVSNAAESEIVDRMPDDQCPPFMISKPPDSWRIAKGERISVDVEGVGWTSCLVERVFDNGWFVAIIAVSGDRWEDWFHWQEEGDDWMRATNEAVIDKDVLRSGTRARTEHPRRCKTCRKQRGFCRSPGQLGHLVACPLVSVGGNSCETEEDDVDEMEVEEPQSEEEVEEVEDICDLGSSSSAPLAPIDPRASDGGTAASNEDRFEDNSDTASHARIREACALILGGRPLAASPNEQP